MNETENEVELEREGPGITVDDKGEVVTPVKEESSGKVSSSNESFLDSGEEEGSEATNDVPGSEGYDEREATRAARRDERHKRKESRRNAIVAKDRLVASLQMQVQDLSERLAKVDQRQSGTDYAKLDEELNRAVNTVEEAKRYMKSTAEAGDWEGNIQAAELFYNANRQAEHLNNIKQRVTRQPSQAGIQQPDPRVARNAAEWMSNNRWYKHGSTDTDSVIAKAVDDGLAREGYDPRTTEYWDEFNDRLSEKLPHRFGGAKKMNNGKQGGSPNVGGSDKNSLSNSGKKGFYLSEARVKAMKESGDWDDLERRKKMITRYQDYDKQNKGAK